MTHDNPSLDITLDDDSSVFSKTYLIYGGVEMYGYINYASGNLAGKVLYVPKGVKTIIGIIAS